MAEETNRKTIWTSRDADATLARFAPTCSLLPRRELVGSLGINDAPNSAAAAKSATAYSEKLGPIFKMHCVVVVPFSAPNESMPLEHFANFVGHTVAIGSV